VENLASCLYDSAVVNNAIIVSDKNIAEMLKSGNETNNVICIRLSLCPCCHELANSLSSSSSFGQDAIFESSHSSDNSYNIK